MNVGKKLLITGFEPFGGDSTNNSWEIAQATVAYWEDQGNSDFEIVCEELPVSWGDAKSALTNAVIQHNPSHLVCLGLDGGVQKHLLFEAVARNEACPMKDNYDEYYEEGQKADVPIDKRLEQTYLSTLPKTWLYSQFADSFDQPESTNAGGYLCNFVFFHAMTLFPEIQEKGFIHVGEGEVAKEAGVKVLTALAHHFNQELVV